MTIKSIIQQGCFQPGMITVTGTADPQDSIYLCQESVGNVIGKTFADGNGAFTVSGPSGQGTWNIQLTTQAGGGGAWTTPLVVTVT